MIRVGGHVWVFDVQLRISINHHQPALIFAAAASARRYTGPCAIGDSQVQSLHCIDRLAVSSRNVGQGTRIDDAKPIRPFDPQVRVQNSPWSPTPRYRCGSNGMEQATFSKCYQEI